MARKPVIFKPQLFNPEGINNYSGELFRCFTRGDTLPFEFTFTDEDGAAVDITGWKVWIIISDKQATDDITVLDQTLIEVEIPQTDLGAGVHSGNLEDTDTDALNEGINYAMVKYVTAAGESHIMDMCILEVYPSATFTSL